MCLAVPARAQVDAPAQARTSIDCRNLPLRTALRTLVQNARLRHQVQHEVPEIRVTLKLRDVPFEDALKVLLRQASFSGTQYRLSNSGELYKVQPEGSLILEEWDGRPGALPPGTPTVAFLKKERTATKSLLLREALERIFTAAGAQYVVDENIPDVTVSVPDAPMPTLWGGLLRVVGEARRSIPGLHIGQIGEIYVIATPPQLPVARIEPLPLNDGPYGNQHTVSIRLVNVPLRAAIDAVLGGSGRPYSVNPEVPDVPITIEIRDMSPMAALRLVLRQAARRVPGLTGSTS